MYTGHAKQISLESTLTQPLVRLTGVDVAIAGTTVLHDIDWTLEPGTCWGVSGANGSGKSTFLALVAGHVWPAPGRGRRHYDFGTGVQNDAVQARRAITLVGHELQDRYARYGWNFTAEDVVLSGLLRTDIPRRSPPSADQARVSNLLRELDLAHLAARRFLELSRGEQRRVLIARGVAFRPRVLLLDEPASGLDDRSRAELSDLVARVAATTTVVCAAHEAHELPAAATDLLVLEDGKIAWRGPRAIFPSSVASGRLQGARAIPRSGADTAAPALVEIVNADVWLGGRRVLADLSWRLARGEHWLIRGRNGAGKSTFLKLVHGQLRPARGGTLRWPALGDPRNVWQLRRQIGYVSAELHAEYRYPTTVHDCVASGLTSSIGRTRELTPPEQERTRELLGRFGLVKLASRRLTTLSYGQMHRALLARTLVSRPQILLLDEPWEGLDSETSELVRAELAAAMAEGTHIVCVSHVGARGIDYTNEATIDAGTLRAVGSLSSADADAALRESSASAQPRERDYRPR
jgi:molybdate transport system ATP-binding protein